MDEEREFRGGRRPRDGSPGPPAEPGDHSHDPDPHHQMNNPADAPDETEWPDPYDHRPGPLDPPDPDGQPFGEEPHPQTGSFSTSQPHPGQDPEANPSRPPERDNLDD